MRPLTIALIGVTVLSVGAAVVAGAQQPAAPNDNRTPAGHHVGDTLALRLVAEHVRWYIHTERERAFDVLAFAEEGRVPTIPGPLLRARAGTPIRVSVRNPLDVTLIVRGLGTRRDGVADPLVIPPGATTEATFTAGHAGAYVYWGVTATSRRLFRSRWGRGPDSQLSERLSSIRLRDPCVPIGSWCSPGSSIRMESHCATGTACRHASSSRSTASRGLTPSDSRTR